MTDMDTGKVSCSDGAGYRQKNHELKARLKKGASYLEAKDVEAIIEIATYGLVKLELTELPLFKQY